jgi:ankyrin repeat protein
MVRILIEDAHIDPDTSDQEGWTPLLLATKNCHWWIVKKLVSAKSSINVSAQADQNAPLHFAAMAGNAEIVKLLLDHGAHMHQKNAEGKTPLRCAVDSGDLETIKLLVPDE